MRQLAQSLFWPTLAGLAFLGWLKWQERKDIELTRGSLLVQSASPDIRALWQRRVNEENS